MKNNFLTKLSAVALAGVMALTFAPAASLTAFAADDAKTATKAKTATVYRAYNTKNGEHLFTTDKTEYDKNVELGLQGEGEAWTAPVDGEIIYRIYNPNSGEHLLIKDKEEYDAAVLAGWDGEGPKMYSDTDKGTPVYRLFNPNAKDAGSHLYTTSRDEYNDLVAKGWKGEGIKFYGVAEKEEGLKIVSAEQKHANVIEVVLSKALTDDDKVTLAKGTEDQKITTALSDDKKTVTITTADNIVSAKYTVTVTPKTGDAAKETITGQVRKLSGLKFGEELALASASNFYEGYVALYGVDQFEDKFGIPQSKVTVYASTATKGTTQPYNSETQTVTVTKDKATGQLPFSIGEKVTLTAIYQNGTEVINGTGVATVSNAAYVAEMTFGKLDTENTALKDKPVTVKNLYNGKYYIPVVAKDQYGNVISKDALKEMVNPTKADATQTLFVTPAAAQAVYAGFDGFDTVDGKTVMRVNSKNRAGDKSLAGTATINVSALGGYQTSTSFDIITDSYIDSLTVEVPGSLFATEPAEVEVSGIDQNGEAVNLYDLYDKAHSNETKIAFKDENRNMSSASSSITVSGATIKAVTSASKKTIKFYVTPARIVAPATTGTVVITTQSASMKVSTSNYIVGKTGDLQSVVDTLADGKSVETVEAANGQFDFFKAVRFKDSNGEVVDYKSPKFPAFAKHGSENTGKDVYSWSISAKDDTANDTGKSKGTTTDDVYTVSLYKGEGESANPVLVDSKEFTIRKTKPDETYGYDSYELKLDNDYKLALGDGVASHNEIHVYGTDKYGNKAELNATTQGANADYKLTVGYDNAAVKFAFGATDNKLAEDLSDAAVINTFNPAAALSATNKLVEGKLTVTVWNKAGVAAKTIEVPYSNAPAQIKSLSWKVRSIVANNANNANIAEKDYTEDAADEIKLANPTKAKATWTNETLTIYDSDGGAAANAYGEHDYVLKAVDQYGNDVKASGTTLLYGGVETPLGDTASTNASKAFLGKVMRFQNGTFIKDILVE